jgi:ADP-ribosyl-[dinitrogen reductase] hydrolase
MQNRLPSLSSLEGCLMGVAAADMVGLPFENLSAKTIAKIARRPLEPSLILGRSLASDDTEHAFMTARCLAQSGADEKAFAQALGGELRWWMAALPPGVGMATLKACGKLWLGVGPRRSGTWSGGNGACMRAAIIGASYPWDASLVARLVRASSVVTHRDPQAVEGAILVALAAMSSARAKPEGRDPLHLLRELRAELASEVGEPMDSMLEGAARAHSLGWSATDLARDLGCPKGPTGYVRHTVPCALLCWLRHPDDFRSAAEEAIFAGGDTDSVAAIAGGVMGCSDKGRSSIPDAWLDRHWEPAAPRAEAQRLAKALLDALAHGASGRPSVKGRALGALMAMCRLPRNLCMVGVVVYVAFRRLALAALTSRQRSTTP